MIFFYTICAKLSQQERPNSYGDKWCKCYHPLSLEYKLSDFVVYKEFNK